MGQRSKFTQLISYLIQDQCRCLSFDTNLQVGKKRGYTKFSLLMIAYIFPKLLLVYKPLRDTTSPAGITHYIYFTSQCRLFEENFQKSVETLNLQVVA